MKRTILTIMVLAFCAVPALAGQNPGVQIYLYTTSTGVGGFNHKASPAAGANTSVYVCFDHFGPGGGMTLAQWQFIDVPGPNYLSSTNMFAGVGGLIIGDPAVAPGIAMTTGADALPDANGIVVLARIRYETPEEGARRGGSIQIVDYSAGDGSVVLDLNLASDEWCVHSVALNGLSGNFGWDDSPIPDGNCASPVEARTWGSIKALYR
jgi:hypothetical protein